MADIFYPLEKMADWVAAAIFGDLNTRAASSLSFFLADTIKIIALMFLMIFIMGIIRTYIPPKKIKEWLSGKRMGVGNVFAALFGAVTPFCSCSSVPIYIGLLEAGIPLGVALSFLITSPLINEYLVVIMLGFFGWKITAAYVISGLLIGIIAGIVIGKLGLEKYLVKDLIASNKSLKENKYSLFKERAKFGFNEAISITKKIWIWVIAGVGVAAVIHNYIPEDIIHNLISKGGSLTVPIAILIGVPLYASCSAVVPIAAVLFQKGIPVGTALAFMMATAGLSFPEAIILRRAMKLQLIAVFFGIVALGIIVTGYLFNFLQSYLV